MMRRLTVLGTVAVMAALVASTPVTLAWFTAAKSASGTFTTGMLNPPIALAGTGGSSASLAWTASTSTSATGYNLLRSTTSGSGYALVKKVTPVSAVATTDAPGSGTWYYVLDTYLGNWTSVHSNEASVLISGTKSTATVGCDPTMQAPETTNAGNNNGYELNPGSACASGGTYAIDANSGTTNVNSCADPGKDRHQFWGFAFGLPATVSSIDGITVTSIVGQGNGGGLPSICLQLSWDGGTTWTAAKQVPLTATALTTYTAGSTSDTWGHAWSVGQLTGSALRVRITNVATTPNKDFRLDFLGVSVGYTP